jgi:preprotein translocase SecE subunit
MARDRQRSKARQRARAAQQNKGGKRSRARDATSAPDTGLDDATVEDSGLVEDTVPNELEHSSSAVDEAHLAEAGADIPAPNDDAESLSDEELEAHEAELVEFERDQQRAPDELELPADMVEEGTRGSRSVETGLEDEAPRRDHKEGGKLVTFLRGCIDELRRVQWPDRPHVFQATAVVLGFCLVAGGFLGLMDAIWQPLINAIL